MTVAMLAGSAADADPHERTQRLMRVPPLPGVFALGTQPGQAFVIDHERRLFQLDLNTLQRKPLRWNASGTPSALAVDPLERWLAVGTEEGEVLVLDLTQHTLVTVLPKSGGAIHVVAFSPDGRMLAVADRDGPSYPRPYSTAVPDQADSTRVVLWDASTWRPLQVLAMPSGSAATTLFFLDEGETLLTGASSLPPSIETAQLWDVPTGRLRGQRIVPAGSGSAFVSRSRDGCAPQWSSERPAPPSVRRVDPTTIQEASSIVATWADPRSQLNYGVSGAMYLLRWRRSADDTEPEYASDGVEYEADDSGEGDGSSTPLARIVLGGARMPSVWQCRSISDSGPRLTASVKSDLSEISPGTQPASLLLSGNRLTALFSDKESDHWNVATGDQCNSSGATEDALPNGAGCDEAKPRHEIWPPYTGAGASYSIFDLALGKTVWTQQADRMIRPAVASLSGGAFVLGEGGKLSIHGGTGARTLFESETNLDWQTVAASPDASKVVAIAAGGSGWLIDPGTGALRQFAGPAFEEIEQVQVRFADSGREFSVLAGDAQGHVSLSLFDGLTGAQLAWKPLGKLAGGTAGLRTGNLLRKWVMPSGLPDHMQVLELGAGHANLIGPLVGFSGSFALSPQETLVATGSADGTVQLWDAATGVERLEWRSQDSRVVALAFGDEQRLAILHESGHLQVIEWRAGK